MYAFRLTALSHLVMNFELNQVFFCIFCINYAEVRDNLSLQLQSCFFFFKKKENFYIYIVYILVINYCALV